jgi:hypothetical protein
MKQRIEGYREFKVGDVLWWTSQSAGVTKTKHGPVVAIVPARVNTDDALRAAGVRGHVHNAGSHRDHKSYVIRCEGRLYWPYVSKLMTEEEAGQTRSFPVPETEQTEADTKPERVR